MSAPAIIAIAAPFTWWGMVLAISGIEAPLKFRAPGITTVLGLGIGRLVFRALNLAEFGCAGLTTLALMIRPSHSASELPPALLGALWVVLLIQVGAVRPVLDRRARLLIEGRDPPPSRMHLVYVALEAVKVVLLPLLGIACASSVSG
jgi:hypothetical protein